MAYITLGLNIQRWLNERDRMEEQPSNFCLEGEKQPIVNRHIDTLRFIFLFYLLSLLIVEIFVREIIEQGI